MISRLLPGSYTAPNSTTLARGLNAMIWPRALNTSDPLEELRVLPYGEDPWGPLRQRGSSCFWFGSIWIQQLHTLLC